MEGKKQVSFASSQTLYFSAHCLCNEERINLCWYTNEDLQPTRAEVRETIELLQSVQGNLDAINETGDLCLRGVEKYADAVGKYRNQRLYLESVLKQQKLNREDGAPKPNPESLAVLSRYMSKPSLDIALFYAARNAAELERIQQLESATDSEKEDSDVSSDSWIDVNDAKLMSTENSQSSSKKRQRTACFDETKLHSRKIQCCE